VPGRYLLAWNKADLLHPEEDPQAAILPTLASSLTPRLNIPPPPAISTYTVSCATGEGLDRLEEGIAQALMAFLSTASSSSTSTVGSATGDEEAALITRERHRRHVKRCAEHLDSFMYAHLPMDAAAEELR
jgi:hypothetical protein